MVVRREEESCVPYAQGLLGTPPHVQMHATETRPQQSLHATTHSVHPTALTGDLPRKPFEGAYQTGGRSTPATRPHE